MPTISIPPPYRGPTHGKAELSVEGATVRACIEAVEARYPGFRAQILDDDGGVHRFVRLFLNGRPLDDAPLDAAVGPDDALAVLAAIAGGARLAASGAAPGSADRSGRPRRPVPRRF